MASPRPELTQWLAERGYSDKQIAKILARLDDFDARINRESVFDAIDTGEFDFDAFIKDALKEGP
jgi:hypothetical protein